MRRRNLAVVMLCALVGSTCAVQPAHAKVWGAVEGGRPQSARMVTLELRAALISPLKDSGQPWDGFSFGPPSQNVSVTPTLFRRLMRGLRNGDALSLVAQAAPWAMRVLNSAAAAPDVVVHVEERLPDGRRALVLQADKVPNKYSPSWSGAEGKALFHEDASITFKATDFDLENHDLIGHCRIDGIPIVDESGYIDSDSIKCDSQLLAVSVFVREE